MTNSKHVPKRRFKEFESDGEWEKRKLGDLSNITAGGDVDKAKLMPVGNFPVLANAHTGDGIIGYYDNEYQIEAPAVTVTGRGEIGFAKVRRENFTPVVRLLSVKSNHNVDFLAEAINLNKVIFESTGVPQLTIPKLSNYNLFFPSKIEEENTLGDFMRTIDNVIANNQHKLDKLKDLKKAYLTEMFPAEGERVPKRRFPGFEGEWEQKKLGDVGKTFTGLSGKTKVDFGHGDGVYVTYLNIYSNEIADLKGVDKIEIDDKQTEVEYGDVFFTTSSETPEEVGLSSVWKYDISNVYLNSFCFGFRPTIKFDLYFLAYLLRSPAFRYSMKLLAQGISRYNISKRRVLELNILFPSIKEQEKIGKQLSLLDKNIDLQQQKLDKLNNLKKAYLNELFV